MALVDRKIPIIAGRNDIPTTSKVEENHPNGSFLISRYNSLIDNELSELETTVNNLSIPSSTDIRGLFSVTGNGSYDSVTGVINISNATYSVDHISLTNTSGIAKTYTVWADSDETVSLGTFTVTDGQDGTNGVDGVNGTNGADGQGIVATTTTNNGNGTHTVEFFSDLAKTQKVGEVILNDGVAGANGQDGVSPTVSVLTQSAYDALGSYDSNTFYVING